MFNNRKNDKKPGQEFYDVFKHRFPHAYQQALTIKKPAASDSLPQTSANADKVMEDASAIVPAGSGQFDSSVVATEADSWHLTPLGLDHSLFNFNDLGEADDHLHNPHPSLSFSSLFHPQAGDLHTPGVPFPWGTPISGGDSHALSNMDFSSVSQNLIPPNDIHLQPRYPSISRSQTHTLASASDLRQDSGYASTELQGASGSDSTQAMSKHSGFAKALSTHYNNRQHSDTSDRFRFHVTLNAPTAMISQSDEIPMTYLNKGQTYALTITDTASLPLAPGPLRYRTVIRVSFEEAEQREKPANCWQLWKEGRGVAESHHRDGRLQAVEFVETNLVGNSDHRKSKVDVEMASFDSFAVTWSPSTRATSPGCSISVRFNFLSTDFSHSKGVKGIPIRLCAKTALKYSGTPETPMPPAAEVVYCKAKLFRDHGAERKLSNDIAHIKKTIEKVKQQIVQAENGAASSSRKRKRSDSTGQRDMQRPMKSSKHKRASSVSSSSSDGRPTVEESLNNRLATLQDMFTSTRPVSVLHLKGGEQDDPDVYPVVLAGVAADLTAEDTTPRSLNIHSNTAASLPAIKPVARSTTDTTTANTNSPVLQPAHAHDWKRLINVSSPHQTITRVSSFGTTTTTTATAHDTLSGHTPECIEAGEIDLSYNALTVSRGPRPVMCCYILNRTPAINQAQAQTPQSPVLAPGAEQAPPGLYKAVYLFERTVSELIRRVGAKCGVEVDKIASALRVNSKGLRIHIDDEGVAELPEGQDMLVDFLPAKDDVDVQVATDSQEVKMEDASDDGESGPSRKWEMRLVY